jgi:hypothetical protein
VDPPAVVGALQLLGEGVVAEVDGVGVGGEQPERQLAHPAGRGEPGHLVAGALAGRADPPDHAAGEQLRPGQLAVEVGGPPARRWPGSLCRAYSSGGPEVEPGPAAVGQLDRARTHPPAGAGPLVDDDHLGGRRPGQQSVRAGQPGEPGPDDRDPRCHPRLLRSVYCLL